ncbi:MAG: NADH-ubiquinone oxidoreductase-F iron-sulfur binding region domain-containing protein, partial [Phycisphaerae bacterium]
EVRVSVDSMDIARGSGKVFEAMRRAAADSGTPVRVKAVGAHGMAYLTPLVEVVVPGRPPVFYGEVQPDDAEAIIHRHFPSPRVARRVRRAISAALDGLLTDEAWEPVERRALEVRDPPVAAFIGPQRRLATERAGELDPLDLDEYAAGGGFEAARRCLEQRTPEQVIETIRRSGLRGRGGAGFPTGEKWASVCAAAGDEKYVVANGDEGDPGAFMDRMILESYPYRVIEGMILGAFAVGAHEGILYIRHEYPLAVRRVGEALERCEACGILGERVLGTDFALDLRIMEGAGAFVCGEETAMMASIMGGRGMPRFRPPYPSASGLWGRPTLINNTETFALVPWIVREGADAFAAIGTEHSKGTKVFALAGKVARGGLIEVPMGVTLGEVVEQIGGGVAGGRRFKAVQVGGPSGGCIPARLADTPVDYEALTGVGAMMGSGGLVVLDEDDCMVDIARYFLAFTQDQSCGKCTFCRIGTRRMLDILERIVAGEGRPDDLERLEHLGRMVREGSLCGLGKTAPNPVLSTLRYFREEYEAHLAGRCPAGVCKALVTYRITDDCIGCTRCAQHCPVEAIAMRPYEKQEIDAAKCVRCGTCRSVCPSDAVRVE